ncbi:MAG: 3-phosphoshikimate 1-carboxyvinyltransferase [Gammaproteobacteria bacterium]
MNNITFKIQPSSTLHGEAQVPGDKSISHRVIMLGSLAKGITQVRGFLAGEDCLATLHAFKEMGVTIEQLAADQVNIQGVGLYGLQPPNKPLDLGNAGTAIRLLAGIMAAQTFDSVLTGDESLRKRPMARIMQPLSQMGARITAQTDGVPPLHIRGGQRLHGIRYNLPVASAQVKSCLLLAGLYAEGETSIIEPAPTRDHTERMLTTFSYPVRSYNRTISLEGGGELRGMMLEIPADISSAAFFMVGASITPGSEVLLKQVGINPKRIGVINILRLMGADIAFLNEKMLGAEPVADIQVRAAPLHGIDIPLDQVPLAIDEFPVLFIAAACAKGTTVLRGAEELRVKESDRIHTMVVGLKKLGIKARSQPDGIVINGGILTGGEVDSFGDHRIAMAFAMAGLVARDTITIFNCINVNTSFPNFVSLAKQLGMAIETSNLDKV